MSKRRWIAWCLPLALGAGLGGPAAAASKELISRVVIYPDRAQVYRAQEVACGERVPLTFEGLPPAADAASLRALSSLGRVEGLRSEVRSRLSAFAKETEQLTEEFHKLELEAQALQDARARSESAGRVASGYSEVAARLISREMSEGAAPSIEAWRKALDAVLQVRLQGAGAGVELAARQRELERRLQAQRERLGRQRLASTRRDLSAEVLVSCPVGQTARVELSYLVGGARWSPAHEARLGDRDGAVELSSYATISQSTGEDWRGAQIIVSTAVPRQNATPPELTPLRVYAGERAAPRKVLVAREELQRHAEAPAQPGSVAKGSGMRAVDMGQGVSVQFVAAAPGDVRGDGTPARVLLARSSLRGSVRYRAAPRLLPHVFRVADLHNSTGYPLLAGPIDAYRRQQFIARYDLERVAAGERFQLSFGLEEGLKLRRHIIEEMEVDRGLLGRVRRHRFAYLIEVANYLGRAEEVELSEQVPVSELDDVKTGVDARTTAGYELRAADGILTWRLPLRAGEQRKLELRFFVDAPTSYGGS